MDEELSERLNVNRKSRKELVISERFQFTAPVQRAGQTRQKSSSSCSTSWRSLARTAGCDVMMTASRGAHANPLVWYISVTEPPATTPVLSSS